MIDNLLKKIDDVQNEQSLQALALDSLENNCEEDLQAGHKTHKSSTVIRWNSCLTRISSILDLFIEINEALKRFGHKELTAFEKEL